MYILIYFRTGKIIYLIYFSYSLLIYPLPAITMIDDESLLSPSDHLLLAQLETLKGSPAPVSSGDPTQTQGTIQVHHHHHHHYHMDDRSHSPDVTTQTTITSSTNSTSNSASNSASNSTGNSTTTANNNRTDHSTATDIENNSINDNALKSSSNNPLTTIPTDFDLDFIPSLGESTAFPPSASHFPPPTPLHKALNPSSSSTAADSNHHQQPSTYTEDVLKFISPILPGQNEKSFNDQHFYHRQQQQLLNLSKMSPVNHHRPSVIHQGSSSSVADLYHQPSSQHVRPDVIFTPLVSPAVTPLENVSKSNHKMPLTSFEPLTSPALNAISHEQAQQQQLNQISSKRRSSSSFYAPQKDSSLLHPVTKRRTPHSTPTLAAHNTNSSTTLINSPKIKGLPSTSPNIKLESQQDYPQFDRLPDSSVDEDKDEAVSAQSGSSTPHLMGFTMGKLAQDKAASSSNGSCAPYNSLSRTSSASSTSTGTSQSPTFKGGRPKKLILKTSPIVSPHLGDISKSELVGGGGGGATKKTSHKLAEQVRRNRMNMAVHELGRLVPQSYHDQVTIPSKATTVELGSKYIRDLLAQIDQLQLQLD